MRKILACVSLAALLAAGCDVVSTSGGGGGSGRSSGRSQGGDCRPISRRRSATAGQEVLRGARLAAGLDRRAGRGARGGVRARPPATPSIAKAYREQASKGASAAEREAGLTLAAIEYGQALATGAVDPRKLFEVYDGAEAEGDIAAGLDGAVEQGEVAAVARRAWRRRTRNIRPCPTPISPTGRRPARSARRALDRAGRADRAGQDAIRACRGSRRRFAPTAISPPRPPQPPAADARPRRKAAPAGRRRRLHGADMAAAVEEGAGRLRDQAGRSDRRFDTIEALNIGARPTGRGSSRSISSGGAGSSATPPPTRIDVNTAAALLHYWQATAPRRTGAGSSSASPNGRLPSSARRSSGSSPTRPGRSRSSIAEEEIIAQGRRLHGEGEYRHEERPAGAGARAEIGARPGQVRHGQQASRSIFTTRRPRPCSPAASATPATAARGSRMRSDSPDCSPRTTASSRRSRRRWRRRRRLRSSCRARSRSACSTTAPIGRLPGPVPDRPLWLGRQGRRRARPRRPGPAAGQGQGRGCRARRMADILPPSLRMAR